MNKLTRTNWSWCLREYQRQDGGGGGRGRQWNERSERYGSLNSSVAEF